MDYEKDGGEKMKLLFIRHGECQQNAENSGKKLEDMIIGRGGPLTEYGKAVSKNIMRWYSSCVEKIPDYVACSDTERAKQTAECSYLIPSEPIGSALLSGPPYEIRGKFEIDNRLNEQFKGSWEGQRYGDVITDEVKKNLSWTYKQGGGESREDVVKRGMEFLEEKVFGKPYETVVLFTHQNFMRSMVTELMDLPKEKAYQMKVANCSICQFEYEDRKLLYGNFSYTVIEGPSWRSARICKLSYNPTAKNGMNTEVH